MRTLKTRFLEIPAISILNGSIVITRGNLYETLTIDDKVPDPLDLIEIITEKYEIIYLIDLNGLMDYKPQTKLIHELSEFCEVWTEAGVTDADSVYDLFVAGSAEVIVSSKTLNSLLELANAYDLSENLIFELDYSHGIVSPNHQIQAMSPIELSTEVRDIGIDRIIFADLNRIDNKNKSLEDQIIRSLVSQRLGVLVGGGIKLRDVPTLRKFGASGAIIELVDILKNGKVKL
jgi:uncharacterized protein related to proFAR isomerase